MTGLTVLKLGGALLTDKRGENVLETAVLPQIAAEIQQCRQDGLLDQLILVHGVGSFGHPPVIRHRLHKGYQSPDQLLPLSQTQHNVMRLRMALADALQAAGVPVCLMLPSSCMTTDNFALAGDFLEAVAGFLQLGMVPLLGGDVLPDRARGFAVFGGDQVAVRLAQRFGAARLWFATAVSAIHTADPQTDPTAQPLTRYRLSGAAADLDRHAQADASGAMAGKLAALRPLHPAIAAGLDVRLFSMRQPGQLAALLQGQPHIGTQIVL